MKICMIGLGSIGRRHITNIDMILSQRKIEYQIDALRSRPTELNDDINNLVTKQYFNIGDLPSNYDIIFITNPTNMHYNMLNEVQNKTKHIFLEKPVFEHCNYSIDSFISSKEHIYYVACPLRYTPVIRYLKEHVIEKRVFSVRAISSSYLPEWRKNVDYRKVYSSIKSLGGGVSLDLIHEWDYLIYLFGEPEKVKRMCGKYSDLEIDSDDLSIYVAKYKDMLVELHLDYFGRYNVRKLELYCSEYVIEADLLNQIIIFKGKEEKKLAFNKEDFYVNEMNSFFDMVLCKKENLNNINQALRTLKVALED